MTTSIAATYEDIPYTSSAYPRTHPRNLEAIATLFGLQPSGLAGCRVLELGCAAGGNIIPVAEEFPGASFLGIDISPRQIEDGCKIVADLGLANIELRAADLMEIDETWGAFDYIICHGVYSWVPGDVQEKILDICSGNLTPNGVAVVSYNIYPGWHFRGIVRDMMRYHVDQSSDPHEQVAQARAALDFLVEACGEESPYGQLLRGELDSLRKTDDSYIYHEHLETFNEPIYFHEFIERVESHGLQYLAESTVSRMLTAHLPESTREKLEQIPLVRREQYIDFMYDASFRSTLLCHQGVEVTRDLTDASLGRFHVQLAEKTGPLDADYQSDAAVTFNLKGNKLTVAMPLIKAALVQLGRMWPVAVSADELYGQALGLIGRSPDDENADLPVDALHYLLRLALQADALAFHVTPVRCTSTVSERPVATLVARYQALCEGLVTNTWHRTIKLDLLGRFVLQRADGEHTAAEIETELSDALDSGELAFADDAPNPDAAEISKMVKTTLGVLAEAAFLVG